MALSIGTNCGFVTTVPVDDPSGAGDSAIDSRMRCSKFVAPASGTISSMGFWTTGGDTATHFDIGIYSHDAANNLPLNRLAYASQQAVAGGFDDWQAADVSYDIVEGTTYWLCVQVDYSSTGQTIDRSASSVGRGCYSTAFTTALPSSYGSNSGVSTYIYSIYALYTAGGALTHSLEDTITLSDSLTTKALGLVKSDSLTLSDIVAKTIGVARGDTVTLADAFLNAIMKARSDTITLSDGHGKTFTKIVADSLTMAEQIALTAAYLRAFDDTVTLNDAIGKIFGVTQADSLTLSDVLNYVTGLGLVLSDTITMTDAITKSPRVALVDTVTLGEQIVKAAAMGLGDAIVLTDSAGKAVGLIVGDNIVLSDSITTDLTPGGTVTAQRVFGYSFS